MQKKISPINHSSLVLRAALKYLTVKERNNIGSENSDTARSRLNYSHDLVAKFVNRNERIVYGATCSTQYQ